MSNHQFNKMRRSVLTLGIVSALAYISGCATHSKKAEPIQVDVSKVKDIPTLIAAIKKSSGNLLPSSISNETFYKEFANFFVKNARAAADLGYAIPGWVLDKLPTHKKVVVPFLGVAVFMLGGVALAVPVSTVIIAVLASVVLMGAAIVSAISAMFSPSHV